MATSMHRERAGRAGPPAIRIEDIEAAIGALTASYSNPNRSIRFTAEGGRVALWGEVDWHYQKMEIERTVRRVRGVRDLTSDLTFLGTWDEGAAPSTRRARTTPTHGL